jgi:hypothetical protein
MITGDGWITVLALSIINPMPDLAAIISAMMTPPIETPIPRRKPVIMLGMAAGIITLKKMNLVDAPRVLAASIKFTLIVVTPLIVLIIMKKKEINQMRKILLPSPMPNHNMDKGIQAMGDIGLIISIIGSKIKYSLSDHPNSNPIGNAVMQAREKPMRVL